MQLDVVDMSRRVATASASATSHRNPGVNRSRSVGSKRDGGYASGGVGSFLETDFAESVRVEHESHKAAASVSVEALRYRKPTADEVAQKCSICFDDFVEEDTVVSMPCSSRHVFHERCVKEWLSRDDSCPLCRSSLPVWLGRPQYS